MTEPETDAGRDMLKCPHHTRSPQDTRDHVLDIEAEAREQGRQELDVERATHPHDGYAYDGCKCVCCVNVRALAIPAADGPARW